jgi:hypothetical protein
MIYRTSLVILILGLFTVVADRISPMPWVVLPSFAQTIPPKTILLSDIPPRFQPAPAFFQKLILNGITTVNPDFKREGVILEDATTFIDLEQVEMILGLTANLPNQAVIQKFDAGLRNPNIQKTFIDGLKNSLSSLGKVKISEVGELHTLKNLGQVAKGFNITAKFSDQDLTIFTESIAFRRGNKVILIILGAVDHPLTAIQAADIAFRLDQRLREKP